MAYKKYECRDCVESCLESGEPCVLNYDEGDINSGAPDMCVIVNNSANWVEIPIETEKEKNQNEN